MQHNDAKPQRFAKSQRRKEPQRNHSLFSDMLCESLRLCGFALRTAFGISNRKLKFSLRQVDRFQVSLTIILDEYDGVAFIQLVEL